MYADGVDAFFWRIVDWGLVWTRSETIKFLRFDPDKETDQCYSGDEAADHMEKTLIRSTKNGSDLLMSKDNRGGSDDDRDNDSGTVVVTKTKPKVKKPSLYRVLLLNDDFTPMEFVVHVLKRFFNKNEEEATLIMLHVHQNGVGECGVFTFEVAETKVTQVMDLAAKHQHPLQCVMEKK